MHELYVVVGLGAEIRAGRNVVGKRMQMDEAMMKDIRGIPSGRRTWTAMQKSTIRLQVAGVGRELLSRKGSEGTGALGITKAAAGAERQHALQSICCHRASRYAQNEQK